jgi:hypothetical protein
VKTAYLFRVDLLGPVGTAILHDDAFYTGSFNGAGLNVADRSTNSSTHDIGDIVPICWVHLGNKTVHKLQ